MSQDSDDSRLPSQSTEAEAATSRTETPPTPDDLADSYLQQQVDEFKFLTFDACVDQWRTYIQRLEYELTKVNLMSEKAQQYRRSLLLKYISVKLKNLAIDHFNPRSLNDVTYEEIVAFVDDYYQNPSILQHRIFFSQCVRKPNHTVRQFFSKLRSLAEKCSFQSTTDERIRDQFLVGLNNRDMLDKIIAQHRDDHATLQEIETTALYLEDSSTRSTASNTSAPSSASGNISDVSTGLKSGRRGSYTRPVKLSAELATVVGQNMMPRHEVVKKIFDIIDERHLRDPADEHFAICDDELERLFGVKRFRRFGLMKFLKSHFSD